MMKAVPPTQSPTAAGSEPSQPARGIPAASVTLDNLTVSQLLMRYLELEGVFTLFGVPGAAIMHLLSELKDQRATFKYIVCRQESGAAYMADGYARVSGKLGVVAVTSGPGATNALTGTMNAQSAGVAMLTITGEVAEQFFGMGFLQEGTDAGLDVNAVFNNASGYSAIVTSPANFQTLFTQALRDALGLPHRAAHISLPDDVASMRLPSVRFPASPRNYRATPRGLDRPGIQKAFERLTSADRPLVLLGSGARDALQGPRLAEFISIVERFALPVMTTPDAKCIFPESHPLSLRNFGVGFCEWTKYYMVPRLLDPTLPGGYDALLVLGTKLGGFATNKWDPILIPQQSLVQVDLDQAAIGRVFPLDFGVVSEIGAAIDELFELAMSTEPGGSVGSRREFIARLKREKSPYLQPDARDSTANPILPQAAMKCISEAMPPGSHVFVDAGNCVGWSLHYLTLDPPTRLYSALAMGPMGFGVAGVVGARLAAPDAICVAIVGDGAFLMHGNEVSTAAANRVGAIWVVLNDNDLGMVSQGMDHFFPDPSGGWEDYYAIGAPNIARMAMALGADAFEVRSVDDMRHALSAAINAVSLDSKPQVIVVHVDTKQVPPFYQDPGFKPPMPHTPIDPANAPKPIGPYNQGIKAGNTVFVSGQGPIDPATGKLVLGPFEDQARLAFRNLKAVVEAGGAAMSDVTMVNIHLADLNDFAALNKVYEEFFASAFPARSTVGGSLLMGIAIEVDCVAVIGG
jgi:acetolactate synthase-1/2/3 large subunit